MPLKRTRVHGTVVLGCSARYFLLCVCLYLHIQPRVCVTYTSPCACIYCKVQTCCTWMLISTRFSSLITALLPKLWRGLVFALLWCPVCVCVRLGPHAEQISHRPQLWRLFVYVLSRFATLPFHCCADILLRSFVSSVSNCSYPCVVAIPTAARSYGQAVLHMQVCKVTNARHAASQISRDQNTRKGNPCKCH